MRLRNQSGGFLPSTLLLLSIAALVMSGVAFVVTRDQDKNNREQVINVTDPVPSGSGSGSGSASESTSAKPSTKPTPKPVDRGEVRVEVYNTSGIKGLAAEVNDQLKDLGWAVGDADNWDGSFDQSTVYYAEGLERAAKLCALDLGITSIKPAFAPMVTDGLSVILTGPLDS